MAEPSLELDASLSGTPTTYDQAIINAGVVDTTKVIRWGNVDSVDGTITNVQRPVGADKWAEELWLEDTDGVDTLINDNTNPDDASPRAMSFFMSSDAVAFATAPRLTVYDSGAHDSGGEEVTNGTAGHVSPLIKARGQTANTAPAQYWGEASSAILHDLDATGAVTFGDATGNEENACMEGDVNYLVASTTDINTTPQYFQLALSVPNDVTPGIDSIDCIVSIRYTYT